MLRVATCNLNQWALDFEGNFKRVLASCREAAAQGAGYRLGPELELSGYGCEDHFLEPDTTDHCLESLAALIEAGAASDLLVDFGLPVRHGAALYNCRIFVRRRELLLVRPKMAMADNGNYREGRYFAAWPRERPNDVFVLPEVLRAVCRRMDDGRVQETCPIGFGAVRVRGVQESFLVGSEICEELWTPAAPHIDMALHGVEVMGNGSGSHHQLRKLDTRIDLMLMATKRCGGVYLYSNSRGCDGGRLYYDGCALIICNGKLLAQASQFSLRDVEVISAVVDLREVHSFRQSLPTIARQAAHSFEGHIAPGGFLVVDCPEAPLAVPRELATTPAIPMYTHTPEEECALGPACWLWDYLRRSGGAGYFLPLSGGADSAATATIVGVMCRLAARYALHGVHEVRRDVARVAKIDVDTLASEPTLEDEVALAQRIANAVFHTCYMGSDNSSAATKRRAAELAGDIGAYHLDIRIDDTVSAVVASFTEVTGKTPRFLTPETLRSSADDHAQDLALQNVQARSRMVLAYFYAQLLPWQRQRSGFLLVLGSGNVDEALRGYLTKYDCSSADLNPIGAISKVDLKRMLLWAAGRYGFHALEGIVSAPPTAELRPLATGAGAEEEHCQTDEADMGMTYEELGVFGVLRKIYRCGPVSMMRALLERWADLKAVDIGAKVKHFFKFYGINRHKSCTLTPAYHAEQYSPDDNRFDHRQFLYNVRWDWQFAKVDALAAEAAAQRSSDASLNGERADRKRAFGGDVLTRSEEAQLQPARKKGKPAI